MARFLAVVISQPAGLGGIPVVGHCSSATTNASCASSSASPRSRSPGRVLQSALGPPSARPPRQSGAPRRWMAGPSPVDSTTRAALHPVSQGTSRSWPQRPRRRRARDSGQPLAALRTWHQETARRTPPSTEVDCSGRTRRRAAGRAPRRPGARNAWPPGRSRPRTRTAWRPRRCAARSRPHGSAVPRRPTGPRRRERRPPSRRPCPHLR